MTTPDIRAALERLVKEAEFRRPSPDAIAAARAALAEPEPVADGEVGTRYEFSVLDADCVEQAGGSAPSLTQALDEGRHYLASYAQDGPHTLELRKVEVLTINHFVDVPKMVKAADGEVAELAKLLRREASAPYANDWLTGEQLCRAADLLERLAPQPVPVRPTNEELWKLEDDMGGSPEDSLWCRKYARAVLARWGVTNNKNE